MVTYADIEIEIRKITGRYNESQMPSATIKTYFNRYYTLHFPEEYKFLKLTSPYVITTTPNVDTYSFPYESNIPNSTLPEGTKGNITVMPPIYCQGYLLNYFQDRTTFYNVWPRRTNMFQVNTGVASTVNPYTGTIPFTPMLRAQLDVFGNVVESAVLFTAQQSNPNYVTFLAQDKPQSGSDIGLITQLDGTLIPPSQVNIGTINYLTGAYSFTPLTPLPSGVPINVQGLPYQTARPIAVLFYNQLFTFRPVPADIYQVEFQVSRQPSEIIATDGQPELDEWYMMLALGTAELIYTAFPDPEGLKYCQQQLDRYKQLAQRRTLKQMSSQRAQTIFSVPGNRNGIGWFGNSLPGGQ